MQEYHEGVTGVGLPAKMWDALPVCELNPDEEQWSATLTTALGIGERTCIAIAHFRQGIFASDDLRARAVAQEVNIPVIGSVGVLIRGIRRQLLPLSFAQAMLDQMIASGYYSPIDRLESFLE